MLCGLGMLVPCAKGKGVRNYFQGVIVVVLNNDMPGEIVHFRVNKVVGVD